MDHKQLKNAILRGVKKGLYSTASAKEHGVSEGTLWRWQYTDTEFFKKLQEARSGAVQATKKRVLAKLRSGVNWKDSAKNTGRTAQALDLWRFKDSDFDATVVALLKQQRKKRSLEAKKARFKRK
jgi:hypothetical protein